MADTLAGSARLEKSSILKTAKRHRVFHVVARSDDPNDDETSNDPDGDDETWDDHDINDMTDLPIAAWLDEMVRYRTTLDAERSLSGSKTPPSRFPTLQRLRC